MGGSWAGRAGGKSTACMALARVRCQQNRTRCPPAGVTAEGQRAPLFSAYLVGLDFDSTLTVPEMMSFFSWSSSLLRSAGTAESRSWNGARATPPFSRVPMYGAASNLPSLSSLMTDSTAVDMVFCTEDRITDLYSAAVR